MNRTTEFDEIFKREVPHYKNHPQMIPFVGKHWGNFKKLLVIGESHYLPENSDPDLIKNWYNISYKKLSEDERWWTATAELLNIAGKFQKYPSKGHSIWQNIELAIIESGFHPGDKPEDRISMFQYIAFMNFFQKPAQKTGQSIDPTNEDVLKANETIEFVRKIVSPDYIYFVSSKAWGKYEKYATNSNIVGHSCHPSCRWWNKKSKRYSLSTPEKPLTGKESFVEFIRKKKIFEKTSNPS